MQDDFEALVARGNALFHVDIPTESAAVHTAINEQRVDSNQAHALHAKQTSRRTAKGMLWGISGVHCWCGTTQVYSQDQDLQSALPRMPHHVAVPPNAPKPVQTMSLALQIPLLQRKQLP